MTEILITEPDPEPTPEPDTTVVVVEAPADAPSEDIAVLVGALTAQVSNLTDRIEALDQRTAVAQDTADVAINIADQATDIAIDSAIETEEIAEEVAETEEVIEDVIEDNPPNKLPWTHRPASSMFGHGE